jgi:hypothetical protein
MKPRAFIGIGIVIAFFTALTLGQFAAVARATTQGRFATRVRRDHDRVR